MLCSVGKAVPGAGCHRVAEREWEGCKKCVVSFPFFISFSLGLGGCVCVYVCGLGFFFGRCVFVMLFIAFFQASRSDVKHMLCSFCKLLWQRWKVYLYDLKFSITCFL